MTEARAAPPPSTAEPRFRRVAVVAEDLIWATRLATLLDAAGTEVARWKPGRPVESAFQDADGIVVDLTARSLEPFEAIRAAAAAGLEVVCVGQHADVETRRRAMEAGATRVWTYNQVHTHGPTLIGRWVRGE